MDTKFNPQTQQTKTTGKSLHQLSQHADCCKDQRTEEDQKCARNCRSTIASITFTLAVPEPDFSGSCTIDTASFSTISCTTPHDARVSLNILIELAAQRVVPFEQLALYITVYKESRDVWHRITTSCSFVIASRVAWIAPNSITCLNASQQHNSDDGKER